MVWHCIALSSNSCKKVEKMTEATKKTHYATKSTRMDEGKKKREREKVCASKIKRFNIMYTLSLLSPFNVKCAIKKLLFIIFKSSE